MNFPPPTPRQARVIWFALTTLAVALTVAIIGAVLWGAGRVLVRLSPVLWPIAVAGIIAFLLDPLVEWLTRRGIPRLRAIILVFGVAVFLVLGLIGSIIPPAVGQAKDLAGRVQEYAGRARTTLQQWVNNPPDWIEEPSSLLLRFLPLGRREGTNAPAAPAEPRTNAVPVTPGEVEAPAIEPVEVVVAEDDVMVADEESPWWVKALDPAALRTAGDWAAAVLPDIGRWLLGQLGRVASWFGIVAGLALIPIYAFYFLLEKSSIELRWTDYLPVSDSRFKDELVWLLQNINDALIVFFRGQVLVAMCDGVMYTAGFLLIGLPYALLLGLVATVLTIVPFLGAIVTCVSALIIAVVEFGDWQHPLLVLLVFVVVQGIEGWVIQPKIIGDRVGLHPVTIIIALLVGTTLMGGLLGGLLAIPATAVIRALMFRYVWRTAPHSGRHSKDKTRAVQTARRVPVAGQEPP
jgi:predicted PurR-regulated permease PerM